MQVLIAVEDPSARRTLETAFGGWNFDVVVARDGGTARRSLLGDHPPRLAILSWNMVEMEGIQLCREIRKRPHGQFMYVFLLLKENQRLVLVEGLRSGADNCLVEPLDSDELAARIQAARRILEAQDQLIVARKVFEEQALHDPLTGLWNHRAILKNLDRELVRGRREGRPVGILLGDLDHFKRVNDTYGHLAGDAALREAARRIQAAIRPYDQVGRYGGEEFLIVLPGCDVPNMVNLGERVRKQLSERTFDLPEGTIPITISVGAAASDRGNGITIDFLLRAADAALYRAKDRGRNRVEVSSTVMEEILTA